MTLITRSLMTLLDATLGPKPTAWCRSEPNSRPPPGSSKRWSSVLGPRMARRRNSGLGYGLPCSNRGALRWSSRCGSKTRIRVPGNSWRHSGSAAGWHPQPVHDPRHGVRSRRQTLQHRSRRRRPGPDAGTCRADNLTSCRESRESNRRRLLSRPRVASAAHINDQGVMHATHAPDPR